MGDSYHSNARSTFKPRHGRNRPVTEFVLNNFSLDRKIKEACADLKPSGQWDLMELPRDEDKELIADFILNYQNESTNAMPMATNTKKLYITSLVYLARHHDHKKSFREMTPDDFFSKEIISTDKKTGRPKRKGYLENLRRTFDEDIEQKWVNTYNNRLTKYLVFYKWWTQSDLKRDERQTPPQLKGFRYAKRKNKTHIKREMHWTPEEHTVFLRYCEDLRLACYHAIAIETGARPSEILQLKLGDIRIETVPSTGKKRCQFWIGKKGKTENSYRPVSISDAIPFFNVWAHVHPARDSNNAKAAYLFPSMENKARYRNVPLGPGSVRASYVRTIEEQFPKLLQRQDIPPEEKAVLNSLIYDKPHYPYLRRHEFASEHGPKLSRTAFNQLMGHSPRSNMQDVYIQAAGNEGVRELEIAKGIRTRDDTLSPAQIELRPKYCPFCGETNKHNAKFCFKCNVAISPEGASEDREKEVQARKEAENTKKELEEMKAQMTVLQANTSNLFKVIGGMTDEIVVHGWRNKQELFETAKKLEEDARIRKEARLAREAQLRQEQLTQNTKHKA